MSTTRRDSLRWLTARPIAHRGLHDAKRGRPENTLAAFDLAVEKNYAIECDLHLSADGVPVVFHDDTVLRLTGVDLAIADLTAAELGDLRILGTREWIPTLHEALALVAGRVPLVLEMKQVERHGGKTSLAPIILETLDKYEGPAAVMSFDPALLRAAKETGTNVPIGLTAMGNWRFAATHFRTVLGLGLDFISYAIDDLPTPMPVLSRSLLRIPLICWTVRTKSQFEKAKRWADQVTFEGLAD